MEPPGIDTPPTLSAGFLPEVATGTTEQANQLAGCVLYSPTLPSSVLLDIRPRTLHPSLRDRFGGSDQGRCR